MWLVPLLDFSRSGPERQSPATSVSVVVSGLKLVRLVFKKLFYQEGLGNGPPIETGDLGLQSFPVTFVAGASTFSSREPRFATLWTDEFANHCPRECVYPSGSHHFNPAPHP